MIYSECFRGMEAALFIHCLNTQSLRLIKKLFGKLPVDHSVSDDNGLRPVHIAARRGNLKILKWIISTGGGIIANDNQCNQPLHHAAEAGHLNIVSYLLSHGIPGNVKNRMGCTPLELACNNQQGSVVRYLLRKDFSYEEEVPVLDQICFNAISRGDLKTLQFLIDQLGFSPEFRYKQGPELLFLAAYFGHLHIVKYLCAEKGLSLWNISRYDGRSLYKYALSKGHKEILKYLVSQGVETESFDLIGRYIKSGSPLTGLILDEVIQRGNNELLTNERF